MLSSASAATGSDQRDTVYAVAKRVISGFDGRDVQTVREATWPDGYHSITRRDWGTGELKRHWRDVPNHGLGVNFETRLGQPSITIHGDRAQVSVSYNYLVRSGSDDPPSECGKGAYRFDLRLRHGEWRVLNLSDTVRQSGRDCS
jgi:hypothetical protein